MKQHYQQRSLQRHLRTKSVIAEQGRKELAKAVTDQGLSVGEYAAMLELAKKLSSAK